MKNLLLISALLVMLFSCGNDDNTQKQRFLIRGNEALKQRDFREATRVYLEAINLDSCYVDAINNLGIVYFEQGQLSKATIQYDRALQCQPDYFESMMNRVNVFYELNELYRALDDLEYIARKSPDSSQVHFMLGLVHTKMRNYDKAIGAFDQSLSLDGNNAETLINRGTVKYYQHQLEAAEIDLKAAMQIDPLEPNTYNAMSIIETERGDFQKALELVNQALGLEKDQAYFLNNRGYIYLNLNELEKAKADIDRSIIKDPNNGWAYRNKGYYYYLLGEYEKAVPLYDQASKLDAFIDKIYLFKSLNYQKLGKPTEACENFQKAKENKEDVAELVGYCL